MDKTTLPGCLQREEEGSCRRRGRREPLNYNRQGQKEEKRRILQLSLPDVPFSGLEL